jgi:hypothetical protein
MAATATASANRPRAREPWPPRLSSPAAGSPRNHNGDREDLAFGRAMDGRVRTALGITAPDAGSILTQRTALPCVVTVMPATFGMSPEGHFRGRIAASEPAEPQIVLHIAVRAIPM